MELWCRAQDGKKLVLAREFELFEAFDGVSIYANNLIVGKYKDVDRAIEVLDEIVVQLRNGGSFDDMYKQRRVSKSNVFTMPKE